MRGAGVVSKTTRVREQRKQELLKAQGNITTLRLIHTRSSEWPRFTKTSADETISREDQSSYTGADEVTGCRREKEPGDQVS